MIKIVAKMVVRPEQVEEFLRLAGELMEKSAAEEGNVSYSLNKSRDAENVFCFLEVWKDQRAVETHNATEHFTGILPKLAAMTAEDQPVDRYEEVTF